MAKKLTPEDLAQWQRIARGYYQTQQKMVQKRKELGDLLKGGRQRLAARDSKTRSRSREFLVLQVRLAELGLAQIECYPVDSLVYQVPTQSLSPAYEARTLEIALVTAQMDHLLLGRLDGLLRRDIPAALAGEGPPNEAPEAWLLERARCVADSERLAAWGRFRDDFAALDAALKQVVSEREAQGAPASAAEYLANMKALRIPQLSGLAYRVHTALKLLEGAEDLFTVLCRGLAGPTGTGSRLTNTLKS